MRAKRFVRSAAAMVIATAPIAAAADVFLRPSAYAGTVGEKLRLEVREGGLASGVAADWREQNVRWLFVRVAGTQKNMTGGDLSPVDDGKAVELPLEHAGATLIGVDAVGPVTEVPGAQLAATLRQTNTADRAEIVERGGAVRVRRVNSSKALINVAAADAGDGEADGGMGENETGPSGVPQSKTGQAAEIRLAVDPLRAKVGSDIPFRVYINGSSRGDVAVTATPPAGAAQTITTNASGMGVMNVSGTGAWLLRFRYAEEAKEEGVDWTIYNGALTFEISEGGAQ